MGEDEGTTDGFADGRDDGLCVRITCAPSGDDVVGLDVVGRLVGWPEGIRIGCADGVEVGCENG